MAQRPAGWPVPRPPAAPVGLEVGWAGTAERVTVRTGDPVARLTGPPGELLLYLFGRTTAAQVEVTGAAQAVTAVHGTHFGM